MNHHDPESDGTRVAVDEPTIEVSPEPPVVRRNRLALVFAFLYAAALVAYIVGFGIPTGVATSMAWIIVGLCIAAFALPNRRVVRVFLDWLPFLLVLLAWDWSRGLAVRLGRPIHIRLPVDIDRALGFGHVPTVWLQEKLGIQDGSTYAWEVVPTLIYITHFVSAPIVAAVLWVKDRERWLGFVKRFLSLMIAGLITYVIVPWAPPWRAAYFGELPPVHRSAPDGWQYLHLQVAADYLSVGQASVNLDAAMPSLHAGLSMLIVLFLWGGARRAWRFVMATYVLGMGLTLVIGGEHYVHDIFAGWLYAAVVHLVWNRLDRRRASARGAQDEQSVPISRSRRAGGNSQQPVGDLLSTKSQAGSDVTELASADRAGEEPE